MINYLYHYYFYFHPYDELLIFFHLHLIHIPYICVEMFQMPFCDNFGIKINLGKIPQTNHLVRVERFELPTFRAQTGRA